jgi:hypothetical protein
MGNDKVAISVKCQCDIICYWNSCFWTSWHIVKGFHCFMGKIELSTNSISPSWIFFYFKYFTCFIFYIPHKFMDVAKHKALNAYLSDIVKLVNSFSSHIWFQRPTSSISNAIIQQNSIVALSKGGNISLHIYTIWTTFVQVCA